MLKRILISLIIVMVTMTASAAAQENAPICRAGGSGQSLFVQYEWSGAETAEQRKKREEKERLQACADMWKPGVDDAPFGFWKHRHAEAHCKGWIAQLLKATNSLCCGGIGSGECRLTAINMRTKEALIDGMWCPLGGAKFAIIEGMDGAVGLVCAGKTTDEMRREHRCPARYCYGVASGG